MSESTDPERSPFYAMPLCPHRIQFDCQQCRFAASPVLEGRDIFDWAVRVDELTAQVDELTAQVLEYEHALEHVIDCGSCEQCMRLVQSALDGLGRADFRQLVEWRKDV